MEKKSIVRMVTVSYQQPTELNCLSYNLASTKRQALVHALDASLSGHKRIKIRRNDTDVIVLAISVVNAILVVLLESIYTTSLRIPLRPH